MRCPDCDYELRDETRECPRCAFRRSLPARTEAAAVRTEAVATPMETQTATPPSLPVRPYASTAKWAGVLALIAVLICAGGGFLYIRRGVSPQTGREMQVRALFAGAEGPCRRGEAEACQEAIKKIDAFNDLPDASLLSTDLRVAGYLRTLPGSDELSRRWQNDEITPPELTTMGNVAYRKNLPIYRSLWIGADIKRESVPVPMLTFDGAKPDPSE